MNLRITLFVCLLLTFILPLSAEAQGVPTGANGPQLIVSMENPSPGQEITITAKNYGSDINSSKITWFVDGKQIQSGTGLTTYNLKAPALGKILKVSIIMTTTQGKQLSGSVSVGSGSVDMILEPDGYVPPFFKGKTPVIYQNGIKMVAIPHLANSSGTEYDPKTLIYEWRRNDRLVQEQSGYGKQSILLPQSLVPSTYSMSVTVRSGSSGAKSVGIMSVTYQDPSLIFYVNDQLYGPLFNSALGNSIEIGSKRETGILAVPFGLNKPYVGVGDLSYTWFINNYKRPELDSNESLMLRAPDATSGSSNIQLDIRNTDRILQNLNKGFSVNFTESSSEAASFGNEF